MESKNVQETEMLMRCPMRLMWKCTKCGKLFNKKGRAIIHNEKLHNEEVR